MAAQEIMTDSQIRLVFDLGIDLDGNPIRKNKNFNNIKMSATATGLQTVVQALVPLQKNTLISVQRSNDYEIVTA